MFILQNEQLKVEVNSKGAELNSIYSKETSLEYLWNGNASYWNKKSPLLFPIVGVLKDHTYYYENKAYKLGRHGFARDMNFDVTVNSPSTITMTLLSNEDTLVNYPFHFRLDIIYSVEANNLHVKYNVTNTGTDNLYFSIGGHPAFKIPLEEDLFYDDYYLEFEQIEDARRWLVSNQGLLEPVTVPLITNSKVLPVTRDLFRKDAIVFKYLNSTKVKLKTDNSAHGLEFAFPEFPFLGLWASPEADFVCIEPWCGIPDATTSKQQFINKEGINLLTPERTFERMWTVTVY